MTDQQHPALIALEDADGDPVTAQHVTAQHLLDAYDPAGIPRPEVIRLDLTRLPGLPIPEARRLAHWILARTTPPA